MRFFLRPFAIVAAVLTLCASAPAQTQAQDYPARTVRIIIPLGAGGGGDIFTRALAEELQKRLGRTFVVENRTGGGLNIGTRACAEAAPDGYTICVLSSEPVVYSQFLFKSLPFDPEKDFEPITNLFFNTLAFAVNGSLKVKTIPELVAAGTPKPIIAKLNAEVAAITADPGFLKKNYIDRAVEHAVTSPEEFARFIVRDRATAARIVKESGAQPE
jgi:tripartite-type tricarboxylate transporter receptor subunit TctC